MSPERDLEVCFEELESALAAGACSMISLAYPSMFASILYFQIVSIDALDHFGGVIMRHICSFVVRHGARGHFYFESKLRTMLIW